MDHAKGCRGHFHCPDCRRRVCGLPTVYDRDGSVRRVVCLACGAAYSARVAIF